MPRKASVVLIRLFYSAFALCFGWVFFCCVFANVVYPGYSTALSLLLVVLFVLIFLMGYRILHRYATLWQRFGGLVCVAVVVVTASIQLVNGLAMRYDPAYDLWAVYGGGMEWAQAGSIVQNEYYMGYFHMFPANLGAAYLFKLLFEVTGLFNITDHYAVALVFNVLLLQTAMILCWDILRRIAGSTVAVLGLAMFMLLPPFYMMGAVFYTDLLSVAAPMVILDVYLVARTQKKTKKKILLYAIMGGIAAAGAVVKFTVIIAFVAVILAGLLVPRHKDKKYFVKDAVVPVLASIMVFVVVLGSYQLFVRNKTLDETRLEKEAMPFSHWVAMGLIGDGGYDEADYDRAMKLPSRAARQEVNRQLILTRLTAPSPVELAKLFTRKALRCFGDGTWDLAIFLDDNPHQRAAVHELVLFDGDYYPVYSQLSQGVYLALMALALVMPIKAALSAKKGARALRHPAPWLCLFGLLLFLMLWETNARYTLNYMPVLVVCAALGVAWFHAPEVRTQKVRIKSKETAGI